MTPQRAAIDQERARSPRGRRWVGEFMECGTADGNRGVEDVHAPLSVALDADGLRCVDRRWQRDWKNAPLIRLSGPPLIGRTPAVLRRREPVRSDGRAAHREDAIKVPEPAVGAVEDPK